METKKNIYQRLSDFREDVGKVAKDGNNPAFRSKYATLPGILDAIQEPLRKNGLTFVQRPVSVAENGNATEFVTLDGVAIETKVSTLDVEESIAGIMRMYPADSKPQTYGSCLTYLRRYGLVTLLGLNVDDDDDGNLASGVKHKAVPSPIDPTDLPAF